MRVTAGRLVELYEADPDAYFDELNALLGVTTNEQGYKCIRDPVFKPRSISILDVGEAACGRDTLRTLHDRPYGMRGGRARTRMGVGEEVGAGALGPSQFAQINMWLGTTAGLLGAEVLTRYEEAVRIARGIVSWQMDVKTQDAKLPRYSRPTLPTEDLQPNQEFPAGNLTGEYVRANRLNKQGEAISVTWEASAFDQTGDLMDAAGTVTEGIGHNVENKVLRGVMGIENTYKYNDVATDTYRTSGSYVNLIDNPLTATDPETPLDNAEMQLLSQTDPGTGRPISGAGPRVLITSQFQGMKAARLQNRTQVEVGAQTDAARIVTGPTVTGWTTYVSQFIIPLLTTANAKYGWTALTLTQAKKRWYWGQSQKQFRYRSAKDLTTYTFTIQDDPSLARRDVLMEMDVSEMGSLTTLEPRYGVMNHDDS